MTAGRLVAHFGRTVLTGCLLAACSTTDAGTPVASPAHHADPAQRQAYVSKVQLRFPTSAYLVGFGAGETTQRAEDDAKVRAAANISSEIHAHLESFQSQQGSGSKSTSGVSVSEDVVQKVATDAGAFIHVHPEFTTLIDGSYEAVAVASREELDGKYARDAEQLLSKVMLSWDSAIKQQTGPIQSVAAALCDARPLESKLDALDGERWLVAGHGVWTAEDKAKRQQVEELRTRLRSTKVSILRTPDYPGVDEALEKAVAAAGFPVDLVGKPNCDAGGLVISVAKDENCRNSMLGPRCDISLTATGNRCSANDALFSETSNTGVGMNSSDQSAAQRAAMRKIEVSKFVAAVSAQISKSVEGDCSR